MGTRPSTVATLVERTSRYTTIITLPDRTKAEQVAPHLTRSLLGIPPQLRRTLTWDLPKGTDLRTFSQGDLDAIAHERSYRPRKTHGYRTPAEVYADLLNSGDALTA
ncbi:transposase [Streptomyces sp. NPDC096311]|uniref:transposase n=1 Tax=Streptomyces sp. NPDC096311 TaxID=3366083 RepID=UPI0038009641